MAADPCSLEALKALKPTRAKKREIVYDVIKSAPWGINDFDIAKTLGWPINCVTPRRLELECAGRLHRDPTQRNEQGKHVNVFSAI